MTNTPIRYGIYEAARTHVPKINPELAVEIGLNESLVFLQIAFLLTISQHAYDERYWIYMTADQLRRETFPYLSRVTVSRALDRLVNELHLLDRRDDLNKRKGDRTYWYALNLEYVSRLTSVAVVETPTNVQNEQTNVQNEQALPDMTTDTSTKDYAGATKSAENDAPDGAQSPKPQRKITSRKTAWEPHFLALVEAFGLTPETLAKSAAGLYWKVAHELYDVSFPPERIAELYRYVREMSVRGEWAKFTVAALAKYSADFMRDHPNAADSYDELMRGLLGPNGFILDDPVWTPERAKLDAERQQRRLAGVS